MSDDASTSTTGKGDERLKEEHRSESTIPTDERGLSEEETNRALRNMVKQGISVQTKTTFTESVFLVGFAIVLQSPNVVIGILAAIPSITQLLQIPSVYIVEKYRNRRMINFFTQLGNRFGVLFLALIPFVATAETGPLLLIGAVTIQAVFTAIGSPSWNSWLRDLVPEWKLGDFFATRMASMGIVAIIASLLGGFFVSEWIRLNPGSETIGYSIIYGIAFISGMIGTYFTVTTPEPKMLSSQTRMSFSELVASPFKNSNYRNMIWFSGVWSFSTALAGPFFTVYLLVRLKIDFFVAAGLAALTQLVSVLFFRFWGRLSDRFSNKSILQVATPLFILGTFLWTFTPLTDPANLTIPLIIVIHILTGFSAAGVNLTSNNIGLKLAPRGEASVYLAARGAIMAVTGSIASVIAGILADFFAASELMFSITWINLGTPSSFPTYHIKDLDFLFLISVFIGIYALHRLALVKEEGEVDERIVIDAIMAETRRNVKTISTVDGLRHTFQLPLTTTRRVIKHRKKRTQSESEHPTDNDNDGDTG